MKASVFNDIYISMWTARVTKHVKRAPYLFTVLRPCFPGMGPKNSMPVFVNGGRFGDIRSTGRSDQPSAETEENQTFVDNKYTASEGHP